MTRRRWTRMPVTTTTSASNVVQTTVFYVHSFEVEPKRRMSWTLGCLVRAVKAALRRGR